MLSLKRNPIETCKSMFEPVDVLALQNQRLFSLQLLLIVSCQAMFNLILLVSLNLWLENMILSPLSSYVLLQESKYQYFVCCQLCSSLIG